MSTGGDFVCCQVFYLEYRWLRGLSVVRVLSKGSCFIVGPRLTSQTLNPFKRGGSMVTIHSRKVIYIRQISQTRTNGITGFRMRAKGMIFTLHLYLNTVLFWVIRDHDERPRTTTLSCQSTYYDPIRTGRVTISKITNGRGTNGTTILVSLRLNSNNLRTILRLAQRTSLRHYTRQLTILARRLFTLLYDTRTRVTPYRPYRSLANTTIRYRR